MKVLQKKQISTSLKWKIMSSYLFHVHPHWQAEPNKLATEHLVRWEGYMEMSHRGLLCTRAVDPGFPCRRSYHGDSVHHSGADWLFFCYEEFYGAKLNSLAVWNIDQWVAGLGKSIISIQKCSKNTLKLDLYDIIDPPHPQYSQWSHPTALCGINKSLSGHPLCLSPLSHVNLRVHQLEISSLWELCMRHATKNYFF